MKFSMSEAWREATAMISGNREVLWTIAGIFFFLPNVAIAIAMAELQDTMIADPQAASEMVLSFYSDWWWLIIVYMLLTIVGYLAMLALLRDDARPTVGEALKAGVGGLLPAIGTYLVFVIGLTLVFGLLMVGGTASGSGAVAALAIVIAVVGIVYVCVKCSLSGPVIAIDKVYNPFSVLARSWRLTKGNSFRIFLFYLLLFIVYFVVSIVLGLVIAALLVAVGPSAALLVNGILSGILGAIVSVVFVAVVAAIHRQLSGPSSAAVSQTFE